MSTDLEIREAYGLRAPDGLSSEPYNVHSATISLHQVKVPLMIAFLFCLAGYLPNTDFRDA